MLNGKLALHDIQDVEHFAGAIASRCGFDLGYHDFEDLHAYLVTECWRLSESYTTASGLRFQSWAGINLRLRAIDWNRKRLGRTKFVYGERRHPIPSIVSLDGLDEPLSAESVDGPDGGLPDLVRFLREGSSEDAPQAPPLGGGANGRAAA